MGRPPDGSVVDDLRPLLPVAPLALGIALAPPAPSVQARAALAAVALLAALACARLPGAPRIRRAAASVGLGLGLYLAGGLAVEAEQRRLEAPLRALPRALDFSSEEGRILRLEGRFETDPEPSDDRLGAVLAVESLEDAGVRTSFRSRMMLSWPAPEDDAPPPRLAGRRVRA